jgi:hypothetical protein
MQKQMLAIHEISFYRISDFIKFCLITFFLNTISMPAYAENWTYVGTYSATKGYYKSYVDLESIVASGVRRSFIYRELYLSGQYSYSTGKNYTRVIVRNLVNCNEGTYTRLEWIYQDWNGNTVDSDSYLGVPPLKQAVPGTYADDLIKVACNGYSTNIEPPSVTATPQSLEPANDSKSTLRITNVLPTRLISENGGTSVFIGKNNSVLYETKKPYSASGWIQVSSFDSTMISGQFLDSVLQGKGCKGRVELKRNNSTEFTSRWDIDGAVSASAQCPDSGKTYIFNMSIPE